MSARKLFAALARAVWHVAGAARGRVFVGPRLCTRCELVHTHVPAAAYEHWLTSGVLVCPCGYGVLTPLADEEPVR